MRLETINEFCILMLSYTLLLFTNYMPDDPELLYSIGWFVLFITLGNVAVNMGYMMFKSTLELLSYLKRKCAKLR